MCYGENRADLCLLLLLSSSYLELGVQVKGKKRNFTESVELQVTLKNYDPQRDKRFSGTFKLPSIPRPNMKICMLGNQAHCEKAEALGMDKMSVEDLKKFNKVRLYIELSLGL